MDDRIRSALLQAASDTIEQLGFVLADPELDELQGAAEGAVGCRVRFRGPVSGALEIAVYGPVLAEVAANMLGCDEPASEEMGVDALAEIANVICGNVLPAVSGTRAVFDLSAPEKVTAPDFAAIPRDCVMAEGALGLGEGRMELLLRRYG